MQICQHGKSLNIKNKQSMSMSFVGLPRVRKAASDNYDILQWMICVFLAGSINVGIINGANNYSQYWATTVNKAPVNLTLAYIVLAVFIVALVVLPIVLSLILTSIQPSHLIVPPFYITIVSIVWFCIMSVTPTNAGEALPAIITLGMFYVTLGFGEDWITTKIIGITTEREYVYFEHLRVYSNINSVKERLLTPEIRRALHIAHVPEEENNDLVFKSIATQLKRDITISTDSEYPEYTIMKITYYEVGRYSLRVSPFFIEENRKMSSYIKDVFSNRSPAIGIEVIVPFTNKIDDPAIDRVIDRCKGYYNVSKQLSTEDRVKVGLFIAIFILTGILFLVEQPSFAFLSIAIEVLIAVLGFPDIIRKRRT
jgi:hypothetical protein